MSDDGPLLEALTRRLAECPPEFLLPPKIGNAKRGTIDMPAIVCDHLRSLNIPIPADVSTKLAGDGSPLATNRLRLIALATWLLHDDWFLQHPEKSAGVWKLLSEDLDLLAEVVKADDAVRDPDRREELARGCLKVLELIPKGETALQAADRLTTLDSAERIRVVRQTRDAEARMKKIREKMAQEAAQAAAARYSPE